MSLNLTFELHWDFSTSSPVLLVYSIDAIEHVTELLIHWSIALLNEFQQKHIYNLNQD